jgi:hypothetical protein
MEALDSAKAELDRAQEHLTKLYDEVTAFLDSRPYGVSSKTEMHEGAETFRVKVPEDETFRLGRFGILAGDYVNAVRASLDHLAWGLSLLTTQSPFDKTEFPIFLQPKPASVRKKIPDVPKAAQDLIENLQPYRCTDPKDIPFHQLAMLYTLTNIDKHCHISIVRYSFLSKLTLPAGQSVNIRRIETLDDDEHIVDGTVTAPQTKATLKIDGASFHVLFNQRSPTEAMDAVQVMAIPGIDVRRIGSIYEFVRDEVFPRLSGFLQQGAQSAQGAPRWKWIVSPDPPQG